MIWELEEWPDSSLKIGSAGIERWVQVDQVNGFGGDVFPQYLKVIAVEECVTVDGFHESILY